MQVDRKYEQWKAVTESDFVTLFIKTWFTFIAVLRELNPDVEVFTKDGMPRVDKLDCQHFFRQIFLGYFPDIVQAFDTLGRNVYGDDYTSLHNPIVLSSVLLVYGMFHSTRILF